MLSNIKNEKHKRKTGEWDMTEYLLSTNIGFTGALTILFIALKLLGKISWSWWWVLSPIWILSSIFSLILLISIVIYILN